MTNKKLAKEISVGTLYLHFKMACEMWGQTRQHTKRLMATRREGCGVTPLHTLHDACIHAQMRSTFVKRSMRQVSEQVSLFRQVSLFEQVSLFFGQRVGREENNKGRAGGRCLVGEDVGPEHVCGPLILRSLCGGNA
eukprot:GEMP01077866.1.p1 GENE.GEMP01077866.1~~GEMP01077866.1.p1  ORF type:complete len:137 (-),score=4.14 GEMP01077866.1:280-690(-)